MPTLTSDELLERARRLIGSSPTSEPCNRFSGDPLHGSCCGHSYTLHLVNWLATDLHRVIQEQEARQKAEHVPHTLRALANSGIDIKCGSCMEIAFTGLTTHEHTCDRPVPQVAVTLQPKGLNHESDEG